MSRFCDIIGPEQMRSVTIVGCGNIGSHLARQLAQMGVPRIVLYDPDMVNTENRGTQGYREKDILKAKVHALTEIVNEFGLAAEVEANPVEATKDTFLDTPIVFFAVDDITVREDLYRHALTASVELVVDGRMAAETGQVHVFDPRVEEQCRRYEQTLFAAEDAVALPCTAKGTIYTGDFISALMSAVYKSWCIGAMRPAEVEFNLKTFFLDAKLERSKTKEQAA